MFFYWQVGNEEISFNSDFYVFSDMFVRTLVNELKEADRHSVMWHGGNDIMTAVRKVAKSPNSVGDAKLTTVRKVDF